jgi:hypothetical protein
MGKEMFANAVKNSISIIYDQLFDKTPEPQSPEVSYLTEIGKHTYLMTNILENIRADSNANSAAIIKELTGNFDLNGAIKASNAGPAALPAPGPGYGANVPSGSDTAAVAVVETAVTELDTSIGVLGIDIKALGDSIKTSTLPTTNNDMLKTGPVKSESGISYNTPPINPNAAIVSSTPATVQGAIAPTAADACTCITSAINTLIGPHLLNISTLLTQYLPLIAGGKSPTVGDTGTAVGNAVTPTSTPTGTVELEGTAPLVKGNSKVAENLKTTANSTMQLAGVYTQIGGKNNAVVEGLSKVQEINNMVTMANTAMMATQAMTSMFADGGIIKGKTKFSGLTPFANGGITNGPTAALIGEGANREAVVPLPNNREIPVQLSGDGGSSSVTVTQNFDFRNADPNSVAKLRAEAKNIEETTFNRVFAEINRGGKYAKMSGRR